MTYTKIVTLVILISILNKSVSAISIGNYLNSIGVRKIHIKRSILDDFMGKEDVYKQSGTLQNEVTEYKRLGPKYFCRDKDDEGRYEHSDDCHKYWHCLYVGTIFEIALERKCPVGTMFHPLNQQCEISTRITCSSWKKSIYGNSYVEPKLNNITDDYLNNYYLNEFQNKFTNEYYEEKQIKSDEYPIKFNSPPALNTNNQKNVDYDETLKILKSDKAKLTVTETPASTIQAENMFEESPELIVRSPTTRLVPMTTSVSSKTFDESELTTISFTTTRSRSNLNFSPLDELLIEKIGFLKKNKLNKTQMSTHLNLIKHIFEFKNRTKILDVPKEEPGLKEITSNAIIKNDTVLNERVKIKTAGRLSQNNPIEYTTNSTSHPKRTSTLASAIAYNDNDLQALDWNLLLNYNQLKATNKKKNTMSENFDFNEIKPNKRPDLTRLRKVGERKLREKQMAAQLFSAGESLRVHSQVFGFFTSWFCLSFARFL